MSGHVWIRVVSCSIRIDKLIGRQQGWCNDIQIMTIGIAVPALIKSCEDR